MEHNQNMPPVAAENPGPLAVLVDEFVADIRRRVRAIDCLIETPQPHWSFDPNALPTDNAEKLVAIKREVEQTFNTVFSNHRRSRNPKTHGAHGAAPQPKPGGPRTVSRSVV